MMIRRRIGSLGFKPISDQSIGQSGEREKCIVKSEKGRGKYRLAVLADIHGNLPALEAILNELDRSAPLDGLLVAGDLSTCPYQEMVLQRLREIQAVMIQGNGEEGILKMAAGTVPDYYFTARQFALGRWAHAHYSSDALAFLNTLPEQFVYRLPGAAPVRIVHGSPRKINESVFPDTNPAQLEEVLALVDEPVVVFAHTHLPWQVRVDGRLALNPGAVCGPLNGQVGAQYAILEWDGTDWQATLHCASYDLDTITRAFIDSGLLATGPIARAFLASIRTGRNIGLDFLNYAFALSAQFGYAHLPYLPDEIYDRAGEIFPWPEESEK